MHQVFAAYSQDQPTMEGKSFAKIFRDSHLLDTKHLTAPVVDIAFAKAKVNKTERKITFQEFLVAIDQCAEKKGVTTEDLAYAMVASCQRGPVLKATKTDAVRLHDDRSTYTGVYAQGGPITVDSPRCINLGALSLEETKQEPTRP